MPEQPWLPFYGDIPASISYPDFTLFELLERSAEEYADQVALEYLGERISYRRLLELVLAAARGLTALGVAAENRIALMLPNTPHAAVLLYAANRIGAVASLLHAEAGANETATKLADFAPQWLAVTTEHVTGVLRIVSGRSVRGILRCHYDDFGKHGRIRSMQRMRRRFAVDRGGIRGDAARPENGRSAAEESPPLFSWRSFLNLAPSSEPAPHRELHSPERLAVVLYTGATTGPSRGVMHTNRQLTAVALQTQVQGPLLAGQSVLSVVPFSHGYGIAVGIHATVSAGAQSILIPHSTPRTLARTIRRLQPEYLIGVPSTFAGLVRDRVFRRSSHRSFMGAFCGGDRLPRSIQEQFDTIVRSRGGAISIREGYGLTETVTACATMPETESRSGSVGIPYPDTMIAIAHPADEALDAADQPPLWLGPDELGEILVSGPTVMTGYWRDEEATGRAFHQDESGQTWLRTGDLGRMDADGFLYFVERMGRAYMQNGVEVHPGLTELVLSDHKEVLETCVTVRHDTAEPCLTAHVTPFDTDRDQQWLEEHLRESLQVLDRVQQPDRYAFHRRLPRTLAGVVDHRRLSVEYFGPTRQR